MNEIEITPDLSELIAGLDETKNTRSKGIF
jgi:hypothetical protein